jgi:predicted nucleic acid-binding protein
MKQKALPRRPVVFLDANVMLSASWSKSSFVAEVVRAAGPIQFLTCTYAVEEVRRNLQVKRPDALATFDELLTRIRVVATILEDQPDLSLNAKDRPIYVSAKAARADILLTGDKDFQSLAAKHLTPRIMTPRELLTLILGG